MITDSALRSETTSALEQRRAAARRLLTLADARDHLYDFIRVMMPDEDGEPGASEYQRTPVGDLLNRIIEDVESGKRNRVAVSIPPQHGKPVAEHELVLMGDGSRKPLRDVVVGDRVITHRGLPRRVAQVFVQGELETLRIRTACGREVMAAPDHPFLSSRGWVLAGELTLRDTLAIMPAARLADWRANKAENETPFTMEAIVSIEPSGKAPCRCLTVEEDHSFVAADFVVHNTLHLSQMGPAWILGRNPRARIIVATYNEIRAAELGDDFRRIVTSPIFKSIFPKFELATGSKSKTAMKTIEGGRIVFVGLGGTVTGRTADYFIIDDPMKDDEELQSRLFRDKMWKWFYAVAFSRGSKRTRIVVLHTRWHSDDLIGRLCDPSHPDRHRELAGIADDWYYLNISGVIKDPKLANLLGLVLKVPTDPKVIAAFGPEPSVALWEENKDLAFFAQWRAGEPRTFSALVMGMPTIEDGEYFTASSLLEYNIADLPKHLSIYGASDHAVSEQQYRDKSVIGCVGVDENDDIWILPDIMWSQVPTDKAVEELISQFKIHRPLLWWMEAELISKSFGPFLHKRMVEEKTYVTLNPVTPSKDKPTRARAIQGRMSMGKVHFPRFAPWWQEARSQLLQFPYGAHDDFVDWLSHVGMGLMQEQRAHAPQQTNVVQLRPAQRVAVETMKRVMAGPAREHPRAAGW